jgi:predicted transcriptional regulator
MTGESAESSDGRGGERVPYEDEEVLRVFGALADRAEPMTARQIADANGRSRSGTYKRAMALVEDGVLRSKKTGPRGRVFWLPLYTGRSEGDTHD